MASSRQGGSSPGEDVPPAAVAGETFVEPKAREAATPPDDRRDYRELREFFERRLSRLEESGRKLADRQTASILQALALATNCAPPTNAAAGRVFPKEGATTSADSTDVGVQEVAVEEGRSLVMCGFCAAAPPASTNGVGIEFLGRRDNTPPAVRAEQEPVAHRVSTSTNGHESRWTNAEKVASGEGAAQSAAGSVENDENGDIVEERPTLRTSKSTVSTHTTRTKGRHRSALSDQQSVLGWLNDAKTEHQRWNNLKQTAWVSYIPGSEEIINLFQWLATTKEPERHGMGHRFVRSWQFSCLCQLVILLNTAFVFIDTNYQIENMQEQSMPISTALEIFFCVFYSMELSLRFYSHGLWFFIGDEAGWNWFDMCLVLVTLMDLLGSVSGNVAFARSFRVLKVIKVLRVVRVLQFFSELRLMINCVLGSLVSLFWCIVMICFVMFLFAVYFTQAVTQHMRDVGPPDVVVDNFPTIKVFFGDVQTSILTMFMVVTGGEDWRHVYKALLPVGDMACVLFLAYIFVFLFSIWNVIMSVFVEKGVKLAQPDTNSLILETRRKQAADAKELRELFRKADLDQSSTLSQVEFEMFIAKPEFKEFLQLRGIDIKEARTFFNMVAETIGDKELDVNAVVRCCLGIKGFATSIDLHILRYEVRVALGMLDELFEKMFPDAEVSEGRGSRRPSMLDRLDD